MRGGRPPIVVKFRRDPALLDLAKRRILQALATENRPMHAKELREAVVGGRVSESYYRGARERLAAEGLISKGQHAAITDAGRAELAARRAA